MEQDRAAMGAAQKTAEQQKEAGAKQIGEVAGAIHGAAQEIEDQMPRAAEYVHSAAARLESGATAIRERSIGELMTSFNELARKEPLAVFGGAMLAGFAMTRFLKSSADRTR